MKKSKLFIFIIFNFNFIFSVDFKTKSYFLQTALTGIAATELELVLFGATNNKYFKNLQFKNKDLLKKIILGAPVLIPIIYYLRGAIPSMIDEKERIKLFDEATEVNFKNDLQQKQEIDDANVYKIFVPGTYVRGGFLHKFIYYPSQAVLGFRPQLSNYDVEILKNENYKEEIEGEDSFYKIKWSEKYKEFTKKTIFPIIKKEGYVYLDWTYDLYVKDRDYAADILKDVLCKNISKKITIVAHSYGGEIAIKALYKLVNDNFNSIEKFKEDNQKMEISLCLVCAPLTNETVKMMEVLLEKGIKIISFHIEEDYVATGDPTNYSVFSSLWKGNVSDIKYIKKHKKELSENFCAILLKNINKDVEDKKKNGGYFKGAWQSAHGLVIYYILQFNLINKFIDNFDKHKRKFVFMDVPSIPQKIKND